MVQLEKDEWLFRGRRKGRRRQRRQRQLAPAFPTQKTKQTHGCRRPRGPFYHLMTLSETYMRLDLSKRSWYLNCIFGFQTAFVVVKRCPASASLACGPSSIPASMLRQTPLPLSQTNHGRTLLQHCKAKCHKITSFCLSRFGSSSG
ncbi:uncharacterized protein LY89DRAFT_298592 [Mollisia scopiformis]|uniref:Uncharacterized protein n=1 Tax=Mollisia scopiformis TaxID=149040 RepID=A0A194XQV0_MOLSC|nr:uncharacterized protein LY89DRAFT_298592 [Mollisia scopiformis]KUJ22429.1 hypothetical protein LY89DRAFT_298592 [Mollisia scopiformis]